MVPCFMTTNFLSIHCSKEVVTIDFVIEPTLPKRNSVNNAWIITGKWKQPKSLFSASLTHQTPNRKQVFLRILVSIGYMTSFYICTIYKYNHQGTINLHWRLKHKSVSFSLQARTLYTQHTTLNYRLAELKI